MASYLAALSETLRTHLRTIDTREAAGQDEWDAYTELGDAYADLAERLSWTAARMQAYRDLPSAPHHEKELADPVLMETFSKFVGIETELATALQKSSEQDQAMLRSFERSDT
jgi:hypothetical protein